MATLPPFREILNKQKTKELPGSPVVWTLSFHCRGHRFHSFVGELRSTLPGQKGKKRQLKWRKAGPRDGAGGISDTLFKHCANQRPLHLIFSCMPARVSKVAWVPQKAESEGKALATSSKGSEIPESGNPCPSTGEVGEGT